jgi:hypothetical protein
LRTNRTTLAVFRLVSEPVRRFLPESVRIETGKVAGAAGDSGAALELVRGGTLLTVGDADVDEIASLAGTEDRC